MEVIIDIQICNTRYYPSYDSLIYQQARAEESTIVLLR